MVATLSQPTTDLVTSPVEPTPNYTDHFPTERITELATEIQAQCGMEVLSKLRTYFHCLANELYVSAERINLIGHAIAHYMQCMIVRGEPWAVQFLFPPQLDPNTVPISGDTECAVTRFTMAHTQRNTALADSLIKQLLLSPTPLFFAGPMFSAKSASGILIHQKALSYFGEQNIHACVRAGMDENSIHARSLPDKDVVAEPVTLADFVIMAQHLIDRVRNTHQSQLLIVEEATFFAANAQEADQFVATVQQMTTQGVRVVLIGLDKNYRGQDLPVTTALQDICLLRQNVSSFHLYPVGGRNVHSDAEMTTRYSSVLGMFDWTFPIVIPRNSSHGINYSPIPACYHPYFVLQQTAPALYDALAYAEDPEACERHSQLYLAQQQTPDTIPHNQ